MQIKVVAAPPAPLKVVTPEELAEGRSTVTVRLPRAITLEIEGCIVTFPEGDSEAVCPIANALFAQGAEIVGADGSFIKRDVAKPVQMRYPSPFSGTKRWKI
jgi:hypothetical protein